MEGSGTVGTRKGRQAMVTAQFVVSVGLLCATAIAHQQMAFIKNAELGIDTEQVLVVPIRSQPMRSDPEAVMVAVGPAAGDHLGERGRLVAGRADRQKQHPVASWGGRSCGASICCGSMPERRKPSA